MSENAKTWLRNYDKWKTDVPVSQPTADGAEHVRALLTDKADLETALEKEKQESNRLYGVGQEIEELRVKQVSILEVDKERRKERYAALAAAYNELQDSLIKFRPVTETYVDPIQAARITLDELIILRAKNALLEARLKDAQAANKRIETQAENYIYALKQEKIASEKREAGLRDDYNELIMFVATKYPDETRHETAMRYILESENRDDGEAQEALKEPAEDWWCPTCKAHVSGETVTFEEVHEVCGTSLKETTNENPPT